jgi:hypothetical protein
VVGPVSEPPGDGTNLRITTIRQTEPDAGASAGDSAGEAGRKIGVESKDTGRQAPLFFGKQDHALVRVGSTFGSAPFALCAVRVSPIAVVMRTVRLGRRRATRTTPQKSGLPLTASKIVVKVP